MNGQQDEYDVTKRSVNYKIITQLLKNSTTGRIFNETYGSPFFNYLVKTFFKIIVCDSPLFKHPEIYQFPMIVVVSNVWF